MFWFDAFEGVGLNATVVRKGCQIYFNLNAETECSNSF